VTKIPTGPKPPPPPASAPKTDAPAKPDVRELKETTAPIPTPAKADSFEGPEAHFRATEVKLDDAFLHAASPSGIENLLRMLESTRAQLLAEHSRLRLDANKTLEKLVAAGFSETQLALARAELDEVRKKMAALRKRLQRLARRMKGTYAHAGKTADANMQKMLQAQLDRLKKLEPGMQRALTALSTIEQAYGSFGDGSPPVLRARVDDDAGAELVDALAQLAPGAVVSRAVHGLLRDAPAAPSPLPETREGEPAAVAGLRAFAEAMLNPAGGKK
jgi:hypothetical protein